MCSLTLDYSQQELDSLWLDFPTFMELMRSYASDSLITLRQIYGKKFLYHLSHPSGPTYGDSLLPLTDTCYPTTDEEPLNFDLIFV